LTRAQLLEVMRQDYIRTAYAKGLPPSRVILKHALRNALIPFVTLVGTLLPAMIGGSVIVEQIFSIPGMGRLGFEAVLSRDYPTIMAIASVEALLTMVGILASDFLYVIVDPRISFEKMKN
ncbi:MAG: ABC transporter permease, partial [Deltaproteobacteria bacterium]|nr:ABC transporter permease [Deltaproteobacteria bacterium]